MRATELSMLIGQDPRWLVVAEALLSTRPHLRHTPEVSLPAIRRNVILWLRRPLGRFGVFVLLACLVTAGLPIGQVHAHSGGDQDHDHATRLVTGDSLDEDDHSALPDPDGKLVLHAHDVWASVPVLPSVAIAVVSPLAPLLPDARFAIQSPRIDIRRPPYRPPIT